MARPPGCIPGGVERSASVAVIGAGSPLGLGPPIVLGALIPEKHAPEPNNPPVPQALPTPS